MPESTSEALSAPASPDAAPDTARALLVAAVPEERTVDPRKFIVEFLSPLLPASQDGSTPADGLDRWLSSALAAGPNELSLSAPTPSEERGASALGGPDGAGVRVLP